MAPVKVQFIPLKSKQSNRGSGGGIESECAARSERSPFSSSQVLVISRLLANRPLQSEIVMSFAPNFGCVFEFLDPPPGVFPLQNAISRLGPGVTD
jgi:hypothetical protein